MKKPVASRCLCLSRCALICPRFHEARASGRYRVEVGSPSGAVRVCKWYESIVAGGEDLEEGIPGENDIPREEAMRIARGAVLATYGENHCVAAGQLSQIDLSKPL